MSEFNVPDEFISSISDIISKNNVRLINKKMDIYDIVGMYLENNQSEDPFFIVNLGDVIRQYKKWEHYLPRIKPFYAVKCNYDEIILRVLAKLGCGFDCASKNEIAKVIDLVKPENIIFANPCKMSSMIKFARAHDVDMLTFDSENELYKIKLYHSDAKLVLRIKTDDKDSMCQFSCKFGLDLDEIDNILKIAKSLNLKIIGVSFHVGSGCMNPETYKTSIKDSRKVFDMGKQHGFEMTFLDIGGGFPGVDSEKISFPMIAHKINEALDEYFSDIENLTIIAEPGRYFVAASYSLVLSVINKKVRVDKETGEKFITYYINDGVYSSFSNIPMDHFVVNEKNLFPFNERNEKKYKCKIFGPTCDSIDKITDEILLPDLLCGEVLIAINMGSYTVATNFGNEVFNGFNKPINHYILN
ncbi:ornithine decaroboxylase [Fadolivirus algeromassiliense]|uniref:ornithine decarboxylase n=1 Tax=Fadolivirus FV1/VV64 TaxID=3070911 RepID=A0A7D3QUZ5_9VIRU|nr:ornithine decaroboxylase [Fadolivirus algeromassiliense]QKF93844.1 ornithine decaroboxylase [Fadolivirus FV1/VV64]